MNKTYPVELVGYRRLGDDGCSLTLHSSVEVKSEDIQYFDEHRGNQCILAITDVPCGLEIPELDIEKLKATMVENTVYEKNITPSERQRRKIYVLYTKEYEREPTKEEFEAYYMEWMNKIDDGLRKKIASYDN